MSLLYSPCHEASTKWMEMRTLLLGGVFLLFISPGWGCIYDFPPVLPGSGLCGNNVLDTNETCDGTDLGEATCESQGFGPGTLSCDELCRLDTSECGPLTCGNGELDVGEECDGTNLDGQTCLSLGHDGGELACQLSCRFDVGRCRYCGNNIRDPGETCDGTDLGDQTCESQGFFGGDLACNACVFDVTGCYDCGPSSGVPCPVGSISDDFDDGVRGSIWGRSYSNGGATMEETGGELVITPSDGETGIASYMTGDTYDMRDDAMSVRLTAAPNPSGSTEASFMIQSSTLPDYVGMSVTEGQLVFSGDIDGVWHSFSSLAYDPSDHAYMRLRESGGTLYSETSPDGITWTGRGEIPDPFLLDAVFIEIKGGNWEPVSDPGTARFDDFNILP